MRIAHAGAAISLAMAMGMAVAGPLVGAIGAQTAPNPTALADRARVDSRRPIDFHAGVFPETVYVGQQTTYQYGVFLTENARTRLRRQPEIMPAELRRVISYELGGMRHVAPRAYGSGIYEAVIGQRAFFPVNSGEIVIPGSQLNYMLPQSAAYYSREERFSVRAESAHLVVKTLPLEGRPGTFGGAVGVLRMMVRIDTVRARVGDPLTLTLRVQGVGNVKLLPRPAVEIPWAGAVAGTERVQVDSSGALIRGAKEFDWVLTPTRSGRVVLPALTYDYFDPYQRKYAVARTDSVAMDVGAGTLIMAEQGETVALLPLRATTPRLSQRLDAVLRSNVAIGALATFAVAAPLPALWFASVARRRRRAPATGRARSRRSAGGPLQEISSDAMGTAGARDIRRAFLAELMARLEVSAHAMSSRRELRRVLRRRGVSRESTARALALLQELDALAFAPIANGETASGGDRYEDGSRPIGAELARARELLTIVDGEAVRGALRSGAEVRGAAASVGIVLLAVLGLSAGAASSLARAQAGGVTAGTTQEARRRALEEASQRSANARDASPSDAPNRRMWRAGELDSVARAASTAYEARRFGDAAQRFADVAAARPQDTDALVNWGTAAWSAGDTVTAVTAWQRAARLDPTARDIAARMQLLPSGAIVGIAAVPPVSVGAVLVGAVSLWVVTWLSLATRARRRARGIPAGRWTTVSSLAHVALALAALGLGAWGVSAMRGLDAGDLEVVAAPETMHVAPGRDSDAMGGVATGDVVKRLQREGVWVRVAHADGREGWLPARRLATLVAGDTTTR